MTASVAVDFDALLVSYGKAAIGVVLGLVSAGKIAAGT